MKKPFHEIGQIFEVVAHLHVADRGVGDPVVVEATLPVLELLTGGGSQPEVVHTRVQLGERTSERVGMLEQRQRETGGWVHVMRP